MIRDYFQGFYVVQYMIDEKTPFKLVTNEDEIRFVFLPRTVRKRSNYVKHNVL